MMDGEKAYRAILNLFKKYGSVETEQKVKKTANEIRNVIFAFAKGQLITCKQRNQSRHFSMEPRRQSTIFVGLTSTIS
jgi:hypothetical protein